MTIRARLLLLSVLVAVGIAAVAGLFSSAFARIETINRERSVLVGLADSIRDLSIAVNSLDSSQYEGVGKRYKTARDHSEAAFAALSAVKVLPAVNAQLKDAFEIIANMHALMTDDLATLEGQFASLQPDLERVFLESRSTTIRMFYTNDRARAQNDLGAVYARIEDLVTSINGLTETLSGVSDTIRDQSQIIDDEAVKIRSDGLMGALAFAGGVLIIVVGFVLWMGNSISRRVKRMSAGLDPVSKGDFSQYLAVEGSDEIARMTKTVNALLDALNRLLREVQRQVALLDALGGDLTVKMTESTSAVDHIQQHVKSSSHEMATQTEAVLVALDSARRLESLTEHLSVAFSQQVDILGQSSSGIEEIIANIRSVNANTARAEQSSRTLLDIAQEGQGKVNLVSRSVDEISKSSRSLEAVSALITDIADKTNLLAMNASIEAAHAGSAGLGFGVVAHEIRKLAEQAATQSQQIAAVLGTVTEHIASIRAATQAAVAAFDRVTKQTETVSLIVHEVQTSMDEQSRGGELVLDGLRQLNEINEQVGHAVGEMKRGESEILDRVQALNDQTTRVNQNNQAVEERAREIGLIVSQTDALAQSTGDQIATIKLETSRFTTSD